MFRKCVSVCLIVLFLAYGGGVGFSLHNCEHCHSVKIFLFEHPDCCPAAEAEHHHKKNDGNHCCLPCKTKTEENAKPKKISSEAYTAHCEQCCVSKFLYFKIKSNYILPQYNKLENSAVSMVLLDLLWKTEKLFFIAEHNDIPLIIKEIPPLLPIGRQFIIYVHQLLFYA